MKVWKLTYELQDNFSSPVAGHSYSLRVFPRDMISQKVKSCECEVYPCSGKSRGRDSFGNPVLTGCCEEPHDRFLVKTEAIVCTEDIPEPEEKEFFQLGMYRYETEFTKMGESLGAFYQTLPAPCKEETDWMRTEKLMHILWESFQYVSGSTNFNTKAEEAFSQGCGVCQDYAHILLAVLRHEGMTVRYVAGAIPGEGQTHAWIEVYQDGLWKGFDPTNNRLANDEYIRFAIGRDAHDCCLNQGIFRGCASQLQEVHVIMEEC